MSESYHFYGAFWVLRNWLCAVIDIHVYTLVMPRKCVYRGSLAVAGLIITTINNDVVAVITI